MTAKLWIVSAVYIFFVAIPVSIMTGVVGGLLGFAAFVGACGLYATVLLLVMGLIDYAKRKS
jgi:hypothetical protein